MKVPGWGLLEGKQKNLTNPRDWDWSPSPPSPQLSDTGDLFCPSALLARQGEETHAGKLGRTTQPFPGLGGGWPCKESRLNFPQAP